MTDTTQGKAMSPEAQRKLIESQQNRTGYPGVPAPGPAGGNRPLDHGWPERRKGAAAN